MEQLSLLRARRAGESEDWELACGEAVHAKPTLCSARNNQKRALRKGWGTLAGLSLRRGASENMRNIVRFKILSESLSPEDISERLGLRPSRSWRKGESDRKKASQNMAKWNGWIYDSGCSADISLADQVAALLHTLEPLQSAIHHISDLCDLAISVVSYCNPDKSIYLGKEVVALIAALGASFDLEMYEVAE